MTDANKPNVKADNVKVDQEELVRKLVALMDVARVQGHAQTTASAEGLTFTIHVPRAMDKALVGSVAGLINQYAA